MGCRSSCPVEGGFMPVEPTPAGGERHFPVTELGLDAAGELVALSGAAFR